MIPSSLSTYPDRVATNGLPHDLAAIVLMLTGALVSGAVTLV